MSTDLQWLLLRSYHSRLVKRTGCKKMLSAEKGNLANTHSFHNNGFIHAKNVDVSPSSSGKGVVLTTRKQKAPLNQIKKANQVQTLKAGSSRQNNKAIATAVRNYRADQLTLAVAKSSAILRGQKAAKKGKTPRVRSAKAKKAAAASKSA